MNIFFPLTYEAALVVENIPDQEERISIETQIAHSFFVGPETFEVM